MSADFYVGTADELPKIRATLKDETGVIDLTAATVTLKARRAGASSPLIDETVSIVSAAAGTVEYTWTAANTATAGLYWLQWRIEYTDSTTITVPNQGADYLWINDFWGGT